MPVKFEEAQVPEETGAAPLDQEAIIASVNVGLPFHASIPAVPAEYFLVSGPVL